MPEYWIYESAKRRGFSLTAKEYIINTINKYKKYKLFDNIADGNNNLVFIPKGMFIEKKSSDELFKTDEFKKNKVVILNGGSKKKQNEKK